MARIALSWELGVGSGYVATMAAVARIARAQGHECVFIVRDLALAAAHLPAELGELVQAPVAETIEPLQIKVQASYASLLHNCGFASVGNLAARLRAWQTLYKRFAIDRVMARHSPTALIAARLANLPLLRYGNGFSEPPDSSPWPSFRPDLQIPETALLANEAHLLDVINRAVAEFGAAPLASPSAVLRGVRTVLLTYPELDHYRRAAAVDHVGIPDISFGETPLWPDGDTPRLFVSLVSLQQFELWLPLLKQLRARSLVRIHSAAAKIAQRADNVWLCTQAAVNFDQAVAASDAVICYGTLNLVTLALIGRKPVGVMAHNPDQLMMALSAQRSGAGVLLPTTPTDDALPLLQRLLDDPALRSAAGQFADRYAGWSRAAIPQRLLDAVLAATPSGF